MARFVLFVLWAHPLRLFHESLLSAGQDKERAVHTPDSRDMIHTLLANDQIDDLLCAALHHGGEAASRDGDVLRALMQAALAEGDMETVRSTASQLVHTGIACGHLMLALEGICLLRNVEGKADEATQVLLDALDARGFSHQEVSTYTAWTPDAPAARIEYPERPPAATLLDIFNEEPLPASDKPFAWIALWPHLTRQTRRRLLDLLHFEMGRSNEPVLHPPRLEIAWTISGEFSVENQLIRSVPGSLVMRSMDENLLRAGRHLRLVGLTDEQWRSFKGQEDLERALEQKKIRARAVHTLIVRSRTRTELDEEQLHHLLRTARMMHVHDGVSSRDHASIALLLEGRVSWSIDKPEGPTLEELRPGSLLHIPHGLPLPKANITLLYWREDQFSELAPLDDYEITPLSADLSAHP